MCPNTFSKGLNGSCLRWAADAARAAQAAQISQRHRREQIRRNKHNDFHHGKCAQNPAEIAAQDALNKIRSNIKANQHFLLEAGAGAGKTFSLVDSLKFIIKEHGKELIRKNKQVACITYTNNAKDEIISRTESHPIVLASTIHSFCWSLIRDFQPWIRSTLPTLGNWPARIVENGEIGNKPILYDLGYPKIEADKVWLHHDDVISLSGRNFLRGRSFEKSSQTVSPLFLSTSIKIRRRTLLGH